MIADAEYFAGLIRKLVAGEEIGPYEKMRVREFCDRIDPPKSTDTE